MRVSADAEPREVRAAFVGVDVVGEGIEGFGVAVVPLQRDLGVDAVLVAAHVDRLVVDRRTCSGSGTATNETMPPS